MSYIIPNIVIQDEGAYRTWLQNPHFSQKILDWWCLEYKGKKPLSLAPFSVPGLLNLQFQLQTTDETFPISLFQNIFPLANSFAKWKMLGAGRHPTGPEW